MLILFIALLTFFLIEIIYFKIANHFNIIDHPNERSSHSTITLRGGGIIFPIAFCLAVAIWQPVYSYIAFGVFAIATISFADDVLTLNNKLRIGVHLLAVSLLLFNIHQAFLAPYSSFLIPLVFLIPLAYIFIIGIINAYNFMDGINGITVLYSFVTVLSIWVAQNTLKVNLLHENVWHLLLASLMVFGFFNFRKKAKTFAGDVGSISMAIIISFLIALLMIQTQEFKWILLLAVYGLDTVATICCRVVRKENIFKAHRSHFYQYLANEKKWSHLLISTLYAVLQLSINVLLIYFSDSLAALLFFLLLIIFYISIRLILEGRDRLFKNYNVLVL